MKRAFLLLLCAAPVPLLAQQRLQFTFGGTGAQEIVQSHTDATSDRFTGMVLGGEGLLLSDRFVVRLRYAQGGVTARDGSSSVGLKRDIVEGEATFGFRALPWLTLSAGPRAWAYTTDGKDQRWLFWAGRVGARGNLLPGRMQTFVELWGGLSASVTNTTAKAGGRGADAGLELRVSEQSPLWGRLSYRIESGHAGDLRETVEAVTFSVIYGLPQ